MADEKNDRKQTIAKTGLYWFTNDLRIQDNRALVRATESASQLVCVYVVDPAWFTPNRYGQKPMGRHRWQFLYHTLMDLQCSLQDLGQNLLIVYDSPLDALATLITKYDIDAIFRSQNSGYDENRLWQMLKQRYSMLYFEELVTHTIFASSSLPFALSALPATFSKFRKMLEPLAIEDEIIGVACLPPHPRLKDRMKPTLPRPPELSTDNVPSLFKGGAREGEKHLQSYFRSRRPSAYKQARNALDGWKNSTKFSPWLANGSVSVKQVIQAVQHYETHIERNESTYWILFELLWREYFQWLAHAHREKLFSRSGVKQKKILSTFYPERYQRWCHGNTPFPLVNACMKQLNATGYMSNRGRQIVASCFVNELDLDWRYGAAYFEHQLVDYDVAINWGNWQYLAGVGTDPRGKRHFDIKKQTVLYDPNKAFITKWCGDSPQAPLDSVNAADWPIVNDKE